MTSSLLYYSILSGLTEDEIREIDQKVSKNRNFVYRFVTKLPLTTKVKAKGLRLYIVFMFTISHPLPPCKAVMLTLPSAAIHRLSPIKQSKMTANKNYP
jgi:hypothetical protein